MEMMLNDSTLTVTIRNSEPVALADFAKSMMSLANDYESRATANPKQPTKLYIKEIKNGSIVAILAPLAGQFLFDHMDLVEDYAEYLKAVLDWLLKGGEKPQGVSVQNLNNISHFVAPVANDKGANIHIQAGNNANINLTINHYEANTVQNKARNEIQEMQEDEEAELAGDYTQVLMYWAQIAAAKNTDQAVIESIWRHPVKVEMSDEVKQDLILAEPQPFAKIHLVDVNVLTYKGKPKLYKITRYYYSMDKED